MNVPETDRWYLWMIVKSWDMPRTQVVAILAKKQFEIYDLQGDPFIRRSDFRTFMQSN